MEVLAPAGNLDKLKTAVLYGAGAVYLSGQKFSLRSASGNFTDEELKEAREFTKTRDVKMFLTLNAYMHEKEVQELPAYLEFLRELGPDAVIVSDLGVLEQVKKYTTLPIHLSTQASCINSQAGKVWKEFGVTRLILGREASLKDAARIKRETGLEVELFVHGAMCMSYSGNCTLSNYSSGRDANRGGCAHNCRFLYNVQGESESFEKFFYSSKDLMGLRHLSEFKKAGIDSLKIEGRMKSFHYVATCVKAYANAVTDLNNDRLTDERIALYEKELRKVSHRDYFDGHLFSMSGEESVYNERQQNKSPFEVIGIVLGKCDEGLVLEVRGPINSDETLELLPFKEDPIVLPLEGRLYDLYKKPVSRLNPGHLALIPYCKGVDKWNVVRKLP